MSCCKNFRGSMEAQMRDLRDAIEEDKWYLSEKEGHDVGISQAEKHFVDSFIERWAANWRRVWCNERCPFRDGCDEKEDR